MFHEVDKEVVGSSWSVDLFLIFCFISCHCFMLVLQASCIPLNYPRINLPLSQDTPLFGINLRYVFFLY